MLSYSYLLTLLSKCNYTKNESNIKVPNSWKSVDVWRHNDVINQQKTGQNWFFFLQISEFHPVFSLQIREMVLLTCFVSLGPYVDIFVFVFFHQNDRKGCKRDYLYIRVTLVCVWCNWRQFVRGVVTNPLRKTRVKVNIFYVSVKYFWYKFALRYIQPLRKKIILSLISTCYFCSVKLPTSDNQSDQKIQ